jgi:hypothetical protein
MIASATPAFISLGVSSSREHDEVREDRRVDAGRVDQDGAVDVVRAEGQLGALRRAAVLGVYGDRHVLGVVDLLAVRRHAADAQLVHRLVELDGLDAARLVHRGDTAHGLAQVA